MSSEAFTTAMFLIAAIIAAGVLINAVFPVIYTLAGTISSSSHTVDERLSNDVKIVTTYASGYEAKNLVKERRNSQNIPLRHREGRRLPSGPPGDFTRLGLVVPPSEPGTNQWTYEILEDTQKNNYWDPGETLYIRAHSDRIPGTGEVVYVQFVLSTDSHGRPHSPQVHNHERGTLVASGIGILLLVVTAYVLVGGTLATTEVMVEAQSNLAMYQEAGCGRRSRSRTRRSSTTRPSLSR